MGDFEPVCALCGCEESAHGGEEMDEDGRITEVCTGCGEPCSFEEADEESE